jgi:hypothetical protein
MLITEYKAINAPNAVQLTQELALYARDGWKPILLSAAPGFIVVILEHVPDSRRAH